MSIKFAIASTDGKVINEHFGKAEKFYIYEVNKEGEHKLLEVRDAIALCQGGGHNEQLVDSVVNNFIDCSCLLVSKIGEAIDIAFSQKGILVFEVSDLISEGILRVVSYIENHKNELEDWKWE